MNTFDEGTTPPSTTPAEGYPAAAVTPEQPPRRRTPRRASAWSLAAVLALTAGGGLAVGVAIGHGDSPAVGAASAQIPSMRANPGTSGGGFSGSDGGSTGGSDGGSGGSTGGTGSSDGGSAGSTSSTSATAAQSVGVVTIDSVLSYQGAESAGTGIVLTSSGEVLTNNHVIEGSTSVRVTVVATGTSYTARVVGTDATDDIAVLQLQGASGLTPAKLASSAARTGDAVTGVGNAGGTGSLTAASGTVTATGASVTTAAEGSAASESLHGLILTDAAIEAGDSGGPLENSSGQVVGIDTAASTGTAQVEGFAIPIATATTIAAQIESGTASATVTIGLPAFLGVELSPMVAASGTGALVEGTVDSSPAAAAGITGGDTITAVAGTPVSDADSLSAALATHEVGDSVSVTWTDSTGAGHTATVVLVAGPAA